MRLLGETFRDRFSTPASGRASALAALLFGLWLCGPTLAVAGGVTIDKPWIRFIIKARPAAGYFTLENESDKTIELTGATSSACGMLMLHQSKEVNAVEHMSIVRRVKVPAHGTLAFAPGGYHLMCMEPQSSMAIGATVPVTLKFADGTTVSAAFPVKGPSGK